ncbi:MAG: M56 family metallopeptidase [Janthinobacterium lividum]
MTTLPLLKEVLSPAVVRALGYALLHSLWQGAVLALVLAGVLPLLRQRRAELRYAVAAAALAALVLAVGGTFGYYYQAAPQATTAPLAVELPTQLLASAGAAVTAPASIPARPLDWLQAASHRCEPYLPLLVGAWLLGALLMGGRLAGGLLYAGRLRRTQTQALGAEWQQRLAALAQRAGLRRPVALLESARVAGPLVLGHLRPVILLPLGAVAGLSPALLEALLAHEVAHIARRDYLLNLGLAVAEVVFFYHPAVWFMANCLRAERENCCDDQAAALCGGDGLRVARALAALAELEAATPTPRLALAAAGAGGRGSLLARVRRLALGRPSAPTLAEGVLASLLTLLGLLGLGTGVVLAATPGRPASLARVPVRSSASPAPADTVRRPTAKKAGETMPVPPTPPAPPTPPTVVKIAIDSAQFHGEVQMEIDEPALRRRGRARQQPQTVVVEKDKKGRLTKLTVNGQEVNVPGKKSKRKKSNSQVEIIQMPSSSTFGRVQQFHFEMPERPEQPERTEQPEAPEGPPYTFRVLPDDAASQALAAARQSLAQELRHTDLNAKQRQELERQMQHLRNQMRDYSRQFNLKQNGNRRFRLEFDSRSSAGANARQMEADTRQMEADARQADADARQADADARQADADAREAGRGTTRNAAELAARRAALRARIAAEQAELRALGGNPGLRTYTLRGRASQPLSLRVLPPPPMPPQTTPPPPPPAPPIGTGELRDALRQDGLIGKTDRKFSFELNDKGGKVNGKDLTPGQLARYRQLLHQPVSGKGKSSSFNITINEN